LLLFMLGAAAFSPARELLDSFITEDAAVAAVVAGAIRVVVPEGRGDTIDAIGIGLATQ
jgi:hypothetical protein